MKSVLKIRMYFDAGEVENLRTVFNREHPSDPPIAPGPMSSVWARIRARLHKKCQESTECVLRSMMERPSAPASWAADAHEWLSSLDIDRAEKEYARVFSNYYYVGAIPIDFDKRSSTGSCIVSSLCSLDIGALYKKGFTQIGIVFNTDVSTGPGQHWVALFCDIREGIEFPRITYFDSYAKKPEKEIQRLMLRWKERWDATGVHSKPMETTFNSVRHQYQDSECGMYCLYFHYCCLMGVPMKARVPDDVVRGLRGVLFRVPKK
jgi:hypothetical protein